MPWYDLRPSWQQGSPSEEFAKSFQNARAATLLPLQVQQMQNQLKSQALHIANQSIQNQAESAQLDFQTRTMPDRVKQIQLNTEKLQAAWDVSQQQKEAEVDLASSMAKVGEKLGSWEADIVLSGVASRHPVLLNSPAYQNAVRANQTAKANRLRQLETEATLNNRLAIAEIQADERLKAAKLAKEARDQRKGDAEFFTHPSVPGVQFIRQPSGTVTVLHEGKGMTPTTEIGIEKSILNEEQKLANSYDETAKTAIRKKIRGLREIQQKFHKAGTSITPEPAPASSSFRFDPATGTLIPK